jgi:glycosidase
MEDLSYQIQRSLTRLRPRLAVQFASEAQAQPEAWQAFNQRLDEHFATLFKLYYQLYSGQYDFYYHLEDLLRALGRSWFARPEDLRVIDAARELDPHWFQSHHMLGGMCYVDLFGGNLEGIQTKIPYFKELGLTYLHLMPLFKMPSGENDGGYAVSNYREVHPPLGTMAQLAVLARELRRNGISLVLDLVFNHTADDHEWAQHARAGDVDFREFYRIFPDRQMPDAYERNLREIFPSEHPGAFTLFPDVGWVWTTFHSYQWDLNYANPAVFNRMAEEMLFLANVGVEVIRLDAVAFIWKKMGTNCENLAETHWLIQAFNCVARIAAPALLFKSEAIVHPDEVIKYIDPGECQLSYNPLLMALLWEALATREVKLLDQALRTRFSLPASCAWVNYVRCHDDIGWTFSDEDAARLNINGYWHRRFLNDFYTGRFPGSFGRGLPFQENPKTGDCRISGTCASLAGLEKAITEETEAEVELAIRRILLIHGVILSIGGIPLIYLGDEIATLNDYHYGADPAQAKDSRWVHRPKADPAKYSCRSDPTTLEGRVFQQLRDLIQLRKQHALFSGQEMQVIDSGSPHVLGYLRIHGGERALILVNFSEREQAIASNILRLYGLGQHFVNLLNNQEVTSENFQLEPYQWVCLQRN